MNIEDLYSLYSKNYLVDTDTRTIRPTSMFFSLKGDNFNGNTFAKKAIELGAKYCVIDDAEYEIKGVTILVENVLETLQSLATYHRKKLGIPIIGITGSNGKTTTKELILAVLKTQFKATATEGNLNNHIGVPLTILSFTNETEIGIVEMGANHQKEIEFLATICEPDLGYITNFGKAHLEGFGGEKGVIKGKSELYTYLKEHNKTALVNPEDPIQLKLTSSLNSIALNNEITIKSIQPFLTLQYQNQEIKTHLVGAYNETNIKVAISIGENYGITEKNIITAIEGYQPTNNRSQLIKKKSNTLLLDAYNANPTSTLVALDNFSSIKHNSKVAILGDMFELGEYAFSEHENIVTYCKTLDIHRCIFVGEEFHKTNASEKYEDFEKLKTEITKSPLKNSYVLIKGSRGMSLERLLEI
ncbi:UDP-N-acetylmuramoyl-tripeptide--D-alanyl-D-alanine ligase, partial [Flavobacteriaceae bacterium]|nr:UDP-N-acetylmuramoyl-tripeptide--D-alanyl-D-alanine ligase [Flavobacteriaceae bacterium]